MKFKALISLAVAVATTFLIVSCDDDINTIGQGIQPDTDNIQMEIDSIFVTAETVKLDQATYLRTSGALLGVLEDDIMGTTKSEFLSEFFCANAEFKLGYDNKATVDSVFLSMSYLDSKAIGDTKSPMAINVYEVNKKNLEAKFYTDINPADYSDKQVILGQRIFRNADLEYSYAENKEIIRHLDIELDTEFGEKVYTEWKKDPEVLKNSANLRTLLKGIYVTSDLNNKMLLSIDETNYQARVMIYYSNKLKTVKEKKDSIVTRILPLSLGGGTIQLNHIIDTTPEGYSNDTNSNNPTMKDKAYTKSPAGFVTKLSIPLAEIRKKAENKVGPNYMINSSIFKLIGMTEEEEKLIVKNRPQRLLFVHKDSIDTFFTENRKLKDPSIALISRHQQRDAYGNPTSGSNNTYSFNIQNTTNETDNLSRLINFYIDKEKDKEVKSENLEFYLVPVDIKSTPGNSGQQVEEVLNTITPTAAIFRTDKKNMKMSLMFSKYNEVKK